jgi:hypothetical protein
MGGIYLSVGSLAGSVMAYLLVCGALELVVLLGQADLLHHVSVSPAGATQGEVKKIATWNGKMKKRLGERERSKKAEQGDGEFTSCARPCG